MKTPASSLLLLPQICLCAVLFSAAPLARALVDSANSNGVSDLYEKQFNGGVPFPTTGPGTVPGGKYDAAADPDGDGVSTAIEAIFGTDCFSSQAPSGFFRPELLPRDPAQPTRLTIEWASVSGKLYTPESSISLANPWTAHAPLRGSGDPLSFTLDTREEPRNFARLQVADIEGEDADLLNAAEEALLGTDPRNSDTDFDGKPDDADSQPLVNSIADDPDGSGLPASLANGLIGRWDFETLERSPTPNDFAYGLNRFLDSTSNARHAGTFTVGLDPLGMPSKAAGHNRGFLGIPASLLSGRRVYSVSLWARLPADAISTEPGHENQAGIFSNHDFVPYGMGTAFQRHGVNALWITNVGNNEILRAGAYTWANYKMDRGSAVPLFPAHSNVSGIAIVRPRGTFTDDQWHHYLYVCNDAYTELYIDGIHMGHSQHVPAYITPGGTFAAVSVGRFSGKALGTTPFQVTHSGGVLKGSIDRLKVWSKALDLTDAQSLYHQDISNDGLWDITGAKTRLWRDKNSNASASSDEFSYISSPFKNYPPGHDEDDDGASDLAEQNAKTNLGIVDTDGGGIPDGWELDNELDPLNPADDGSNSDGDIYNNHTEWIDNTNPHNSASGGQPVIPSNEQISVLLGIGDESGSHSEDYSLHVFRLDPATGAETRVFTLDAEGYGLYKETSHIFRKGETYTFQIQWNGTNLGTRAASAGVSAEGPDFDYTFKVQPQGNHGGLIDSYDPTTKTVDETKKLLAKDASNVAETKEEFTENFQSRRVILVAGDIDIQYASQGENNELEESKENAGDGGYISLQSQTNQGEDITPTTYLVIKPIAGLPADRKVRLKFNSVGRYKVAKDRLGNNPIVSEATEFPAGQETRLYLVGETISQSRGGENITMQIKNNGSWIDGDSVKATVVQTQFQIDLRVFIPYNWVNIPFHPIHINDVAKGDNRNFDPGLNGTYRIMQRAIVNPYPEWLPAVENRLLEDAKAVGVTEHFATGNVTNYNSGAKHSEDTIVKPSYINPGAPAKNSGTADLSQVKTTLVAAISNDEECHTRFEGLAAEPLILFAAAIDWRITVGISINDPVNPTFSVNGTHDGFPAYEIYINSKHSILPHTKCLQWKPPLSSSVLELMTDHDEALGPTTGIINK